MILLYKHAYITYTNSISITRRLQCISCSKYYNIIFNIFFFCIIYIFVLYIYLPNYYTYAIITYSLYIFTW